jgi:hypothetical protein
MSLMNERKKDFAHDPSALTGSPNSGHTAASLRPNARLRLALRMSGARCAPLQFKRKGGTISETQLV